MLSMLQLLVVLVSHPVRLLASSKSASKKQSSEQNMAELFPPPQRKKGKSGLARDTSNFPRESVGTPFGKRREIGLIRLLQERWLLASALLFMGLWEKTQQLSGALLELRSLYGAHYLVTISRCGLNRNNGELFRIVFSLCTCTHAQFELHWYQHLVCTIVVKLCRSEISPDNPYQCKLSGLSVDMNFSLHIYT